MWEVACGVIIINGVEQSSLWPFLSKVFSIANILNVFPSCYETEPFFMSPSQDGFKCRASNLGEKRCQNIIFACWDSCNCRTLQESFEDYEDFSLCKKLMKSNTVR